ncbi:Uncharacterised protein [Streptococcus pneumoniae]|nr:Uncharacterised protein [Streptococcus pneumoniae]
MCFTHSFFHFATLRKSLQTTSSSPAVYMVTDLSVFLPTSKLYFELTSSVLSTISKQLTTSVLKTVF